ncbi:MAG: hypothetical protein IJH70_10845 [Oscillospiraceae bacterium]|nr:hypothetical protein [Oscillospiraceae bacterium]
MSREIKRAMFERTQSMDFDSMMKFFGAPEPAVYEDVEEIPSVAYLNRGEVPLAMDIFRPDPSQTTAGSLLPGCQTRTKSEF